MEQRAGSSKRRNAAVKVIRKEALVRVGQIQRPEQPDNRSTGSDGYVLRLLRNERSAMAGFHEYRSASVESRFTSTDLPATITFLQHRARIIAQKNPFVMGRLIRKRNKKNVELWIPHRPDPNGFLRLVWVDGEDFSSALSECLVPAGKHLVNDCKEPVVRLCAVCSKDASVRDFILTLSISHVIGEVHCLYKIWGMLNPAAENIIPTCIVERVHNFRGNPLTGMKGAGFRKFLWYLLWSDASPFRKTKQQSQPAPETLVSHCCYVNMEWVNEQKRAHDASRTSDVPYLSTQDILTAWFFTQFEPAAVLVAYDMRNRRKSRHRQVTPQHVGNYQDLLVLYPAEYRDPVHIRRAVQSRGAWEPSHNNKPGSGMVGGITGWHSHFVDLELPYSTRQNHWRLRDATGHMPALKNPPKMLLWRTSLRQFAMCTLTVGEIQDRRAMGPEIAMESL